MPTHLRAALCLFGVGLLLTWPLAGCTRVLPTTGIRLESFEQDAVLSPAARSRAYRALDRSTADIYVSDIPLNELARAESFDDLSGTILRVRMFVRPKPGKTPIEPTATSATVQAAVLARGQVGIYGGGAFMLPSGTPGDASFGGSVRGGSVRLLAATPGFVDRLGAARFTGGLTAPSDEAASALLAHVFEQASALAARDLSAARP